MEKRKKIWKFFKIVETGCLDVIKNLHTKPEMLDLGIELSQMNVKYNLLKCTLYSCNIVILR